MSSETYIETIEFRAVAPKTNLRGLDEALQKLNALDAAWRSLQARASGMMQPVMFKKTTADIREAIAAAEKMGRFGKSAGGSYKPASLAPADLAKALGYDPKQLQNFLTQGLVGGKSKAAQEMRRQVREIYSVAQGEFRNVAGASKGIAMFTKHFDPRQDPMAALRMMFGAPAGGAPMSAQAALASAAKVEREHRTSNIQHPTSNVESEDRSKAKQFADTLAAIKRQLAESLNTGDLQKVASARKQAAAKARALVGEKAIPGSGKKYDDAMAWAAGQERQAVETTQKIIMQQGQNLAQLQLDKAKAIAAGDKETGRMLKQQEVALKKSMAEGQKSLRALDQAIYRPLTARQAQREKQAQQVAEIERQQTARRNQMQAVQLQWQTFMAQPGAVEGMRSGRMTLDKQGRWTRTLEGQRPLPGGQMEYFRGSLGQTATMERGRAPVPQDRLGAAVGGLGLRNMAANFVKVASWAVAAIPVYAAMSKGVDLASYSLHRLIETGAETAHLGVVFRGVGGSAQELTNDIIKLAAVEGRETSEMMASATEWARLGGDRKAINEEVRVSAMAANIANMHMSETTRQLSALMHIYGMEAGDLNGVLGMLVNTSLKYNVTLEDLFMGLDRSAGAAKVAGVGLAELQGMIGTVVGKTGQSGIVVGNTIKSLLVQFSNPAIQRQLRGFGIEVLGNNLQQKSGSQILGEMAAKWDTMDSRSKQDLTRTMVGRLSAARFVPLMDDYLQTQKLAIDAQLNLNKAQEANVKILDTLKAQLAGIRAEFDRLIVRSGALSSLTTGARFGKNVLGDLANMGKSTPATELANKQAKDRIVEDVLKTKPWSVRRAGYAGLMLLATLNRMTGMQTLAGLGGFDEYKYYKQMPGLVDFFNITHESPADKGQEAFGSRMQQIQGLSEANARRASFFDFASGKLGRGKMKTEDINLVASEMAQDHAAAFQKAWQTGDTAGAQRILADARERAKKEGVAAAEERAKAYNARLAELNAGLLAQNKMVADLQSGGKNADKEIQQATDLAAAIRRVTDARDEDWRLESEANGELDTVFEMQQRYVNLLKEQADTMELIGRMATQVSPHTALQGMDQQVSALTAELDVLQKQFDQVMKDLPEGPERRQVTDEIRSRQREAEAALASNQSPANRSLAQRFDERARGIRQAENQASAADYGIDATAKLLSQRKELTEDLARMEERLRQSQEGGVEQARLMGQYLRDQSLLYENHLDLARRRANIEREIHQLAIDQNKEFMRSFMGSGPAEMLQKLAAFRMAFDNNGRRRPGLSQGAFFGLSPEMRANYGMLNPQYNPHMIELRNERNRVNGAKNDEPGLTLNDTLKKIEAGLMAAKPNLGLALIPDAIAAAAECIRSGGRALGDELNGITDELKRVAAQVRGLHGAFNPSLAPAYSPPVNAQSGGLGGSKGFK